MSFPDSRENDALGRLRRIISDLGSALIAFSGGIDSSVVLKVAHDTLGARAVAVTAVSATYPALELDLASQLCRTLGVRHVIHNTDQLRDAEFVHNTASRCYRCKTDLYTALVPLAERMGIAHVCDGAQTDDVGDDRPGMKAARECGVRSPLLEAGLGKEAVRTAGRLLGLPNWDKPAAACLSSRIARGELITLDRLKRVEEAEAYLLREGFRQVRVRDSSGRARVEVGRDELARLFEPLLRDRVITALARVGFVQVTLDPAGYRQGSTN